MTQPRLNKYLVSAGLADSRRKADEIIKSGSVIINGTTITDLSYRVDDSDEVSVEGRLAQARKDIYIAYNKPRGEICSHRSFKADKTIFGSLPSSFANLKIAGRLDKDSEGLIILSSDGSFINKISHPSMNKTKAYTVITKEPISDEDIKKLNSGIKLRDGLSKLKTSRIDDRSIKVSMTEGRNRQIRRTLDALRKEVIKLTRIRIGNYSNSRLKIGEYVFINPDEVL